LALLCRLMCLLAIVLATAVPASASGRASGPGRTAVPAAFPGRSYYTSPHGTASSLSTSSIAKPMSLATALASAPAGSVIHLAPGSYPHVDDRLARTGWVTVRGRGASSKPLIHGASLFGARYLRFVDVRFSAEVYIRDTVDGRARSAEHIQIIDSEVDCHSRRADAGTTGIMVRAASHAVSLDGDYVHRCVVGFGSVAQDVVSTNISIAHSTFEDFPGDAIDLGGLSGVLIDHDIIRKVADPKGIYHDDGIQFFGNVRHVRITNNVIANSRDQLIFIQDAIQSGATHSSVNRDILVAHNLIYGAGGWAIQNQGGLDVKFVQNTMWSNHWGSLLVRRSSFTNIAPHDTVIVNNVIQGLGFMGARAAVESHNLLVATPPSYRSGPSDRRNLDPRFVNARHGDFQLEPTSPLLGSGSASAAKWTRGVSSLGGEPKRQIASALTNIGAFQSSDPRIAYGAPIYGPAPLQ